VTTEAVIPLLEERAAAKRAAEERKSQAAKDRDANKEVRASAQAERAGAAAARAAVRVAAGEVAEERNLQTLAVDRQGRQAAARSMAAQRADAKARVGSTPSE